MNNKVLFSIITVNFNNQNDLDNTLDSLFKQNNINYEVIIIDGNSTDGSQSVIKKYEKLAKKNQIVFKWISEPDKGIYDAMNKGITLAEGRFLNFMNAGDLFSAPGILDEIATYTDDMSIGIFYGNAILDGKKIYNSPNELKLKDMARGMVVNHQSCFFKNTNGLIKYSNKLKLCGDQDFILSYLSKYPAIKVPCVIADYDTNGVSSKSFWKIFKEKQIINKKYNFSIFPSIYSLVISIIVRFRDRLIKRN